jgi:hypothetical protein
MSLGFSRCRGDSRRSDRLLPRLSRRVGHAQSGQRRARLEGWPNTVVFRVGGTVDGGDWTCQGSVGIGGSRKSTAGRLRTYPAAALMPCRRGARGWRRRPQPGWSSRIPKWGRPHTGSNDPIGRRNRHAAGPRPNGIRRNPRAGISMSRRSHFGRSILCGAARRAPPVQSFERSTAARVDADRSHAALANARRGCYSGARGSVACGKYQTHDIESPKATASSLIIEVDPSGWTVYPS